MRHVPASSIAFMCLTACGQSQAGAGFPVDTCTGIYATAIDHEVAPPANVALLVRVTDCDLKPLGRRLDSSAFEIREDDAVLSPYEAARAIVPAERRISERTLFALDISGSITQAGLRDGMIDSASELAGNLAARASIAVFAFDGRPDLVPLTYFTSDPMQIADAFSRARTEPLVDDSTNLNGAVIAALATLDRAVEADQKDVYSVAHGSLITFSDGRDAAHRAGADAVEGALDATAHATYAIGVGPDADAQGLKAIGRSGHFLSAADPAIPRAFQASEAALEAGADANYVVSYCSPSRAGKRTLSVVVKDGAFSTSVSLDFNADGFGAGCTPTASTLH
jgi:hypothetical protein